MSTPTAPTPPTDVRGPARTPEALHAIIEDAFNRGDLDAYVGAHDEDATVVVPPEGDAVHGSEAIRAATAPLMALRPRMTIEVRGKVEGDGVALTYARWTLTGTAPDGSAIDLGGRATVVSRQKPDGTWRVVIDNPVSPA